MHRYIKYTLTLPIILFIGMFLYDTFMSPTNALQKAVPSDDTIYHNAAIYTVDQEDPWAEAMHVQNGIITFVGSNDEVLARAGNGVSVIDLHGAFVMPGIHDVHMHPLEAASESFVFSFDSKATNSSDYERTISKALESVPHGEWLLGWGHSLEVLLDMEEEPIAVLDAIAPNTPIAIMEQTSHSLWVNSAALERANITANTPDPVGGVIMKNLKGEPNGILIDNAGNELLDLVLSPTRERLEADYKGLVDYSLPELAKHGITSVSDARTYWQRGHHTVWQRAAAAGELTARVNLGLWAYPSMDDAEQIKMLKDLYSTDADSLLQINQVKYYSDGIAHNTTAAMHDPYHINYFERATNNGINYFTEDRLAKYIRALEPVGFDAHVHAIGDRGVHESLNAIARGASEAGRHRITHVEFVDDSDIPRFAALGVTADAQVAGDFTHPHAWAENEYLVGHERSNDIIPLASLSDAGAHITLSSDWDVSTLNPFVGIEHAITRAPQALSLEETIRAYTIHGAYTMRQEDHVGSLEIGKAADFIILDRNLFEVSTSAISKTTVLATYLAGEAVYMR